MSPFVRSTSRLLLVIALIVCLSHRHHLMVQAQFELGANFNLGADFGLGAGEIVEESSMSSELLSVESEVESVVEIGVGVGGGLSREGGAPSPEEIVKLFLQDFENRYEREVPGLTREKWTYYTNLTDHNRQLKVEAEIRITEFGSDTRQTAQTYYHTYPPHQISSNVRRELEALASTSGSQAMTDVTEELEDVKSRMEQRYLTSRVCRQRRKNGRRNRGECLPLDPDLKQIMAERRDTEDLLWAWRGWRNETGAPSRGDFQKYVELSNTVARRSGFDDHGDYTRRQYDIPDLEGSMSALMTELQPLYENLHAFMRRRLYQIHGSDVIDLDGPIPAHLLGGMWSHSWSNLFDIAQPHRVQGADGTEFLQEQGYDVRRMYEKADEFYTSMGLDPLPDSFWENSVFGQPNDGRNMSCEPTSWDFRDGQDLRVTTCTSEVSIDELSKAHNMLGHSHYQNQYSSQPVAFREPASPAIYEAMSDLTSSEVFSPSYLKQLGLSFDGSQDEKIQLNALMRSALDTLALLPYAYAVEQWRWGVFNGSITPDEYNSKWWELRSQYEGIVPPVNRTEDDFDPGAEFNIVSDSSFAKHFYGLIMKFQFLEALCKAGAHSGPIQDCNLYDNRVAGQRLVAAMKEGKFRSWTEIFFIITNEYGIDTSALVNFYEPLTAYLRQQNRRSGDSTGWTMASADRQPIREPPRRQPVQPDGDPRRKSVCATIVYTCDTHSTELRQYVVGQRRCYQNIH